MNKRTFKSKGGEFIICGDIEDPADFEPETDVETNKGKTFCKEVKKVVKNKWCSSGSNTNTTNAEGTRR